MANTELVAASSKDNSISFDMKFTRKDIIDTIVNEETADLEDAVERAEIALDKIKIKPWVEALENATKKRAITSSKSMLTLLKKLNEDKNITVTTEINGIHRNLVREFGDRSYYPHDDVKLPYHWDFEEITDKQFHYGGRLQALRQLGRTFTVLFTAGITEPSDPRYIARYNKVFSIEEMLATKEGKALDAKVQLLIEAAHTLKEAINDLKAFKKNGKRVNAGFVRGMLNNSSEGKQLSSQLDVLKNQLKEQLKKNKKEAKLLAQ